MEEKLLYILAWIFFFFVHSAFASGRLKRLIQPFISFRYYRLFYNVVSILALIPVAWYYRIADKREFYPPGLFSVLAGGIIVLVSLWLWKRSFINYSLVEFAGTDRLRSGYELRPKLRKSGLNKLVRHPLYAISYLFLAGLFLIFPHDLMAITAILVFLYFPVGIYFEELKLKQVFGEEYDRYRDATPALFPKAGFRQWLRFLR
jgi:protein-S-isoprenylcysteine O-methyltransferase Ste14